jgi:endonuclease YncB( thermonuclease family)
MNVNMKNTFRVVCLSLFLVACAPLSSVYKKPSEPPPTDARVEPEVPPAHEADVFSLPAPDPGNVMTGRVYEVVDGDRLTLLSPDGTQAKIRLAGIDAPGLKQPYGLRARDYLVKICGKKEAEVVVESIDKNRYFVGRVHCHTDPNKRPVDSTLEQLRRGVAWVQQEGSNDAELKALESEARRRRRGLWIDPNPIPPWDWDAR